MNAAVLVGACVCSVLQCVLLAAVVELFLRAFPRIDAAARHRIWMLVVIVSLAFPIVDLAVRANPGAHIAQPARALAAFVLAEPLALAILGLWTIASMGFLARLGASLARLFKLRSRSTPAPESIAHRVAVRARQLGVRAPVCVRASRDIATPICLGFAGGTILIPQRLLETLSSDEIDFVLVHELAHLRRHDGMSNLFAKLVRSIVIWNPVLLFVERRIAFERELACDDTVVALCGGAQRYARCLAMVMLSADAPMGAVPFARSARQGLRRIDLLLRGRRTPAPPRLVHAGIGIGVALGLSLAVSSLQLVALDLPDAARVVSQPAAGFAPARGAALPAAFEVIPAAFPSAAPFAAGRPFALKT